MYFIVNIDEKELLVKTHSFKLFEVIPVEVCNQTGLNFQIKILDRFENLLHFCKSLNFTKIDNEIFMNGEKIEYEEYNGFLEGYQKDIQFNLSKNELNIIKNVGLATSTDLNRYFMTGIYFAENGDIVATNARRLHCFKSNLSSFKNDIVPPKTFKTIKNDACITRYIKTELEKTSVIWEISDRKNTVFSECIEGQFPNYKKVIPDFTSENPVLIKNMEMFKDYKKFTSASSPSILIQKNNNVISKYLNISIGDIKISEPKEMCFNAQYLADVYKLLGSECNLYSPGDMKVSEPSVFSNNNKDVFAVVMPMRGD